MTQQQIATYKAALKEARDAFDKASKRLSEITQEAERLTSERDRLKRTITALAAMCSESPNVDSMGITDAVMEFMEKTPYSWVTSEIIFNLERMGFDMATQKNAAASVHAVLHRLAQRKKIERVDNEESKTVSWRGPNYNKEVDEAMPF